MYVCQTLVRGPTELCCLKTTNWVNFISRQARLSQHGSDPATGAEQGILTESNPILQGSPDLPRVPVGVESHRGALAGEDHRRPIRIIAGPSTPRIPRRVTRMRKPGPG